MSYWLFKSEPETWSWDDQAAKGAGGQEWDGVRNYQARNQMKAMQRGDLGFFYHSGGGRAVVGVVEVIAEAHPGFHGRRPALGMRGPAGGGAVPDAGDARCHQAGPPALGDGAGEELSPVGPAGQRRGVADRLRRRRLPGVKGAFRAGGANALNRPKPLSPKGCLRKRGRSRAWLCLRLALWRDSMFAMTGQAAGNEIGRALPSKGPPDPLRAGAMDPNPRARPPAAEKRTDPTPSALSRLPLETGPADPHDPPARESR